MLLFAVFRPTRHGDEMKKKRNYTYIGGQAVIQGVMMRGKSGMATVVRDDKGELHMEAKRICLPGEKHKWMRFVFLRGVVNFFYSFVLGMQSLLRSSEAAVAEEEDPPKLNRWVAEKWKVSFSDIVTVISVAFGVAIALALFLFLPYYFTELIADAAPNAIGGRSGLWYNLIEGGFRLVIFIGYIFFTLIFRSLRETYCYHGAEHKTINCYEHELPLTVDNVKQCSRMHDRCGTTFIFIVLIISIFIFALFGWLLGRYIQTGNTTADFFLVFFIKILLLPVVAGISYEILRLLARTQSILVLPLKAPGYLLQKLTTREPDEEMIECAILAFQKALEMDHDPESPEKLFVTETKLSKLSAMMNRVFEERGIDRSDAEWILSLTLGIPRSELRTERVVTRRECDKILHLFEERLTGRPLWYIFGNTDFYGYPIEVDERVLIPRPETEILVQQAVSALQEGDSVLDLCTGSGAVAVAIACEAAKDKNVTVVATDISEEALEVARKNVRANKANVVLTRSDLFENVRGRFNIITANPPYIPSGEIDSLQREIRDFEPRLALDGGEDGLDFYRRIAAKINRYIARGGMLILECGEDQAQAVLKLFSRCDYAMVVKDLEGKERVLKIVF